VSAGRPGKDQRAREIKMKEAAYLALTAAAIVEAGALAGDIYKREKIRLRPEIDPGARSGERTAPIGAILAGGRKELDVLNGRLKNLRKERGGLGRREWYSADEKKLALIDSLERQIEILQRKVGLLENLEKDLKELIQRVAQLDPLAGEIQRLMDQGEFTGRARALEKAVREQALNRGDIVAGLAVGTQQVRYHLNRAAGEKLQAALENNFQAKRGVRERILFFHGNLPFLPISWPPLIEDPPRGDMRITEYVGQNGVLATLYECWGVRVPITVLEYERRLYVKVPRLPDEPD